MKKLPCFGKGGLVRFISRFVLPSKPIREKYPKSPKSHKLDNLVMIAEAENTIWRNSSVINVYTFWHAGFEDVEFYSGRRCMHFKKKGR